jgi:predicted transposase/invertase (TIGR01784 family)
MFRNAVLPEDIDKVRDAGEVRSMLSKIAEEIEARGEARGRRERERSIAKNMKDNGEPIEKIMEFTDLSREEIEKL